MKTLLLLLSATLISSAFAGNNSHSDNYYSGDDYYYNDDYSSSHHQDTYYEGLDILEAAADIPKNRLRDLQCRRYPSNRDLCRVEKRRVKISKRNIEKYNGNITTVKSNIQSYIYDRNSRMNELSCSRGRHNPNRDLCRKEKQALNILQGDLLPAVNNIIRRNERPRRDRGERCRGRRNCDNDGRRGDDRRRRRH